MRIIEAIEGADTIEKIFKHLGLWLPQSPPHRANVENPPWWAPPDGVLIVYLDSQIPSADDNLMDLDYPIDSWMN